ncbi:AAA domain-containing protein [Candidatus Thiothrix sp. Deng01]|uniref:AAA domain-containing protein n=1 Tax=Candidatus Thiothrix phosphatis TaxID=3112415 RepID=A0ABU6CSR8_9GAMM|nr:AAA domain-containing protein [Candidatus Thiothrix sp. Deng01]MEB4589814.1 AAA domain-containing protein [Candidatus Thiothrix sp. Deng01]
MQRLRDDVFIAGMELHRAFIDVAAKPLRHNLGALMNIFTSQTLPDQQKQALLPHLWSSLFLVIPLVSTTFASVNRMLGKLPLNSLGWLLVDEAGQALPQAVVGALLRTQRAVIVGDPIQIEPVVILPSTLTGAICRRFGVDPDVYAAPTASVQTLADAASSYVTEIEGKQGSRNVGVPLLVHRRCSEPMFGISNVVAYSNLMISTKQPKPSAIREALGSSKWIHVEGGRTEDKWSEEEGNVVIHLLLQMAEARVKPDVYIITPFVIVADHLRQKIREDKTLLAWINEDLWLWTSERVGTVHTVQGREAEAVIFVLGSPLPSQTGARGWAGGRPNLLNVAVTRAKEVLYVVGNRRLWKDSGLFRELDRRLEL